MSKRAAPYLIIAAFAVTVTAAIVVRAPFEYDEAVYAAKARAWTGDLPDVAWIPSRAPGLPALGAPVHAAGGRDGALRALGLASGVGLLLVVWRFARAVGGEVAGAVAIGVVATAAPIALRSSQFLTDVPATLLLVAAAFAIWKGLERAQARWLIIAAIASAAAFYIRYPSIIATGATVVAAAVVWRRQAITWRAGGAAFLYVALLVPHAVWAARTFGAPWSALSFAHDFARHSIGEGLLDYLQAFPVGLAGPVAGAVMVVGLVTAKRSRAQAFCSLAAVGQIIGLGVPNYGQPRFVFFAVASLCIAGAIGARSLVEAHGRATAAIISVALVASGVFVVSRSIALREERTVLRDSGLAIAERARPPCHIVAPRRPELSWYSGCRARGPAEGGPRAQGPVFEVSFENVREFRPDGRPIARIADPGGLWGDATIYRP